MSTFAGRLINTALILAFGSLFVWYGGKSALFLFVITLLIGVSGVLIHACGPRYINIRRSMQSNRMLSGETIHVRVELEFESRIPLLWIVLCENTPAGVHRKCFFPGMKRQFTYQYQLSGLRRGIYEWDNGRLYWGDIFGWNTISAETSGGTSLSVVPSVTVTEYGESLVNTSTVAGEGQLSEQRSLQGSRGHEFRDYQHGDPMKRIHWKSTAKTGRLQTFVPETMESPSLHILVYEGQAGYAQSWDNSSEHPAFERAVSMAARWIHQADMDSIPYQLWSSDREGLAYQQTYKFGEMHSSSDLERSLDRLALAGISWASQGGSSMMKRTMLEHMSTGSRVIVLSGRMDADLHQWVLDAVSLGIQVEVQLTETARTSPTDKSAADSKLPVPQSQSAAWLEQLQHCGVKICNVADHPIPPVGKVVVTDVGA
ncbi:hypothetical protein ASD24_11525 [Paenibacillus sp. Root52]|uniref:DUF58 domain-containing protein n=1 Tax=Paenibacillus sp. Root52 TaxID=1736552 RepID=UPI0006F951FE|nr:DUF58 domain-containing protein [Paenibacillus sp. Root52]KQY84373.1 hypothetical protein ASD24_11525 [Paenibacillus sp. Root52]